MEYSLQQSAELIIAACMEKHGTSPYEIIHTIAREDYVRIHGPEHHVLDGACILTPAQTDKKRRNVPVTMHPSVLLACYFTNSFSP